jgi:hypothetical protein
MGKKGFWRAREISENMVNHRVRVASHQVRRFHLDDDADL